MATAREVSDRYTELINAHDARGIGALFAEDGVFTEPAGEFRGRAEVISYWERFFEAFPDMEGQDTFQAEAGDTAINEWTVSGTNTGPMETPEGTIPATGKRVSVSGSDALTVRDGLVRSHRAYYDQLALHDAAGARSRGRGGGKRVRGRGEHRLAPTSPSPPAGPARSSAGRRRRRPAGSPAR